MAVNMTCLYVEYIKMIQMNLLQNRNRLRLRKHTYGYQRGKVGGRDKLGVWD